jgi:hypothetical protein
MLKSFIKEIIGASPGLYDPCPSLLSFRNKCQEFEAILVGVDGVVKFRSRLPVSVQHVIDLIDRLPHSIPVTHA